MSDNKISQPGSLPIVLIPSNIGYFLSPTHNDPTCIMTFRLIYLIFKLFECNKSLECLYLLIISTKKITKTIPGLLVHL